MALAWTALDLAEDVDEPRWQGDPGEMVVACEEVLELLRRPEWHQRAACRGQGCEAWFPARGEPPAPAVAVCAGCPVQVDCLKAGMRERVGVWGGSSERGRRALRHRAA